MPSPDSTLIEEFEEALDSLEFDRAWELADLADDAGKNRLRTRVRASSAEAMDRAEKLAGRIQFLARADHYEGLLALAADPITEPLLALLSTELRRGAKLHLDGAVRRQKRFRTAAQRHMKAAAEALVLLDTTKAVGELNKVEARWLTATQREELSKLRNQTEQADAERQELENRTAAVLREHAPDSASGPSGVAKGSSRWRRIPRGGCLGSVVIAVALLALTVLAIAR